MTVREASNKALDVFLIVFSGSAAVACVCGAVAAIYFTINYVRGFGL